MESTDGSRNKLLPQEQFDPIAELFVARARREGTALSVLVIALDGDAAEGSTGSQRFTPPASAARDAGMANRLAAVLERSVRASDLLMQRGASRFVLVALDTPRQGALQLAARLHETLSEAAAVEPEGPRTISVGIATGPDAGACLEEYLGNAEHALAQAVAAGGNQTRLHGWDESEGHPLWAQEQAVLAERRKAALRLLSTAVQLGTVTGIGLRAEPGACPACSSAALEIYPLGAEPTLPLTGCSSDRGCRCTYTSPALTGAFRSSAVGLADDESLQPPRRLRAAAPARRRSAGC